MGIDAKEKTAHNASVGADAGQSIQKDSDNSIPALEAKGNGEMENLEEMYRKMQRMADPRYLHTLTMTELFQTAYKSRPPIIENLLHSGAYLLAGAPKIGKSFLVAQIAYHVSTGQELWGCKVHQGTVLYLALEDDFQRIQNRMFMMYGVNDTPNLHFATAAGKIGNGLDEQLENFMREHPDTKLIIIDTMQKIREVGGEAYSYASDYEIVGKLKQFADKHCICVLTVHHTRKQPAGDAFEMISGTTGLLGCADGSLLMQKKKRTALEATIDVVGRDQQDQILYLKKDPETQIWNLERMETEPHKEPPDPVLEAVAKLVSAECPEWTGSPSELAAAVQAGMAANALTKYLNVKSGRLLEEYHVGYENKARHAGRQVKLTYMLVEAPAFEVVEDGRDGSDGCNGENATTQTTVAKVADVTTSYPVPIGGVEFTDGFERVICDLLAKLVEKPVLTERESMILSMIQSGRQSIVEAAKNDFSDGATTVCPYCFREIDDEYRRSLINSINKVLNKDVDEHKAELRAISFPGFGQDYSHFTDLDAGLVKEIQEQIENCQKLIEQYKAAIQLKLNSIYNPVNMAPIGLENSIQQLNVLLSKLESKRQEFVDAIQRRKAILRDLLLINKKIAHLQIGQAYRDYQKQQREMRAAEAKLRTKQKEVNETSEHLKTLEQQKSNAGLAIENINNALDYVFFSHGRLSIELKNDKYYLKSNGNDVKPKNVSLGERNIIALCYFFTQILANQDIEKLYQNEELVVIDDPISSFDFENKVGISSFLRYQTKNILVGNSKSKILFLTHDLLTFFDLQKIADEMGILFGKSDKIAKSNFFELSGQSIRVCATKRKTYNEYRQLLDMIFRYATGDTKGLDLTIGNAMRRSLEAFSTFIYGTGISEVSFNPKVIKSLGEHSSYFENLMYRLVLNGESHLQAHIYGVHSDLNFYEFISEDEKRRTCKDILCFMYCLNPDHIGSHIPDAVSEIQKWTKDIPTNKRFDIMANAKKRTIPLYDIPLSAGLGENILDSDIPFVEYETNVEDGDFALHVSGDSMEPDIPDGSIVVVKKQSEIADGISGAFFLNGEVYCKKLLHKDGKVFLCSDNAGYQPIEVHDGDTLIVYGKIVKVLC